MAGATVQACRAPVRHAQRATPWPGRRSSLRLQIANLVRQPRRGQAPEPPRLPGRPRADRPADPLRTAPAGCALFQHIDPTPRSTAISAAPNHNRPGFSTKPHGALDQARRRAGGPRWKIDPGSRRVRRYLVQRARAGNLLLRVAAPREKRQLRRVTLRARRSRACSSSARSTSWRASWASVK
jgi:hypothetical protein